MSEEQKLQLVANLAQPLKTVPKAIQCRQLSQFRRADPDYGARMATALGVALQDVATSPA